MAKSANLLVDGLGAPGRVGLLLPLHWQSVALLLAGVATGATVVVAAEPAELAGCDVAFVLAPAAEAALDAGVDEVLALSGHPLGAPCGALPAMVQDFAREVPSYGDHHTGAAPGRAAVEVRGEPLPLPGPLEAVRDGRLLVARPLADRAGLAVLLGALAAGAGLVLVPDAHGGDAEQAGDQPLGARQAGGSSLDLAALADTEHVSATAGLVVPGRPDVLAPG